MASVYLNPPQQRDHSDHHHHHRHPFQLDHHDDISHLQQLLPYSSSSSSSHDQVHEPTAAIFVNSIADQRMMKLEESQQDHLQKVDQCMADGGSSNVESPPIQASKMITMNNNISNSNLPLRKREVAEIRSASVEVSSSSSSSTTSAKWTSSKMRLMQKMISKNNTTGSADDDQDQYNQQHENGRSSSSNNTSNSNAIRVCSDCNTTTTPLWRSGPRGPKSLCNACGIRKRKARRALEAAAAGGGGGGNGSTAATAAATTTITTNQSSFTKIKLQIKKPRTSHVMITHHHHHQQQQQQLNKQQSESDLHNQQQQRYDDDDDDDDDENQSQGKLCFQGFGGNDSALKQVFTQDVEEAAHLLMELSCGAFIHTC